METEFNRNFLAVEKCLEFLTGKPVYNIGYVFTDIDGNNYPFDGWTALSFKIWEDGQDGKLLLSLSNMQGLTLSGNVITMNASAGQMNIAPSTPSKYYYEMSYFVGMYEITLLFGECRFLARPV